ncbi:alpha/beta hydrolase [Sphingobacterium sp. WOUb80]|uniref:alpha/beta hydrolase n=1 Tax=Sphingobacterium sp. WOUb80 TaxID=3234028 RepID=UPI003CEF3D25
MRLIICLLCAVGTMLAKGQELYTLQSAHLSGVDSGYVYIPKMKPDNRALPVVYVLHSHGANYKSLSKFVDFQALSDRYGFVVVCPDGLRTSWFLDSPQKGGAQFGRFLTGELMPYIQGKYHTDRDNSFITGVSMGGHGALWLFFNYPSFFKSAGSSSGVVNLRHSAFKKTSLAQHLGQYSDQNPLFDRFSVIHNVHKIAGSEKAFIFDCGTEDYLYGANKSLRDSCDVLKIKSTYIAQPGAHTSGYWAKTIPVHFAYFNRLIH